MLMTQSSPPLLCSLPVHCRQRQNKNTFEPEDNWDVYCSQSGVAPYESSVSNVWYTDCNSPVSVLGPQQSTEFGYVFTLKISSPLNQYSIYLKLTGLKPSMGRFARPSCPRFSLPHLFVYYMSLYSSWLSLLPSAVPVSLLFGFSISSFHISSSHSFLLFSRHLFLHHFFLFMLFLVLQTWIWPSSFLLLLLLFFTFLYTALTKMSPTSSSSCPPLYFLLCVHFHIILLHSITMLHFLSSPSLFHHFTYIYFLFLYSFPAPFSCLCHLL